MVYKIKVMDNIKGNRIMQTQYLQFSDAEEFLDNSNFILVDDMCRVWEREGVTARVIKEDN